MEESCAKKFIDKYTKDGLILEDPKKHGARKNIGPPYTTKHGYYFYQDRSLLVWDAKNETIWNT